MVLDLRETPYTEAFMQLRNAMEKNIEEVVVFVDLNEHEKSVAIKGFAEILLGCKAAVNEAGGFYILKITREVPLNTDRTSQLNTEAVA